MVINIKENITYSCYLFLFIIHKLPSACEKEGIKPLLKHDIMLLSKNKCIEIQIQYYQLMIYDEIWVI